MAPGSDAAAVVSSGNVDTAAQLVAENALPPAPPEAWQALQKDCQLVFSLEIRGKYIVPFTSPKAAVIARVIRDRYLRSAALPDIKVDAINPFYYPSYDSPLDADPVPLTGSGTSDDSVAAASTAPGGRRRLAGAFGRLGASRDLLQLEKSGAELKIVVATAQVRVDSEIAAFEEGVESGMMARDFTLAGVQTENLTLLMAPFTEDLIGPGNSDNTGGDTGVQVWVIALIVGVVLLVLPVPTFLLVRWRKRKNREARELQAAETEAARHRMQSKMLRPGSKSFSLKPGGSSGNDLMVRSGSMGGLAGFNNNGRLQSWSGSPERYNQYAISRQTSATSMGSALQSGRNYGQPQRVPSMPGQPRGQYASPMMPLAGAYEEELQAARSARSNNDGH